MSGQREKSKNRIAKILVAAGVGLVACFTMSAAWYLHQIKSISAEEVAGNEPELKQEVEAVRLKENQAVRNFLNQPAPAAAEGDNRTVFRIVEVIPHEACSVFPYLFEWGSKEEYDKNTPLGYEGVRFVASNSGLGQFGEQGMYSTHYKKTNADGSTEMAYLAERKDVLDSLSEYNKLDKLTQGNVQHVAWWRETEMDNVVNASGYFEYVGDQKGLYYINLSKLVETDSTEYGIRYRVTAMARKGSEVPKGEWTVNDSAYFWAKDYSSLMNYPVYKGETITRKTENNYDLKFAVMSDGDSAIKDGYRVDIVSLNQGTAVTDAKKYEYEAVLAEGYDWKGGFLYSENGNYTCSQAVEYQVGLNAGADLEQELSEKRAEGYEYVWIPTAGDPYSQKGTLGKFRLITDNDDIKSGDFIYKLTFTSVAAGGGKYILNPAEVQRMLNDNTTNGGESVFKNILFQYAGENKGTYDVVFMYSDSSDAQNTPEQVGVLYDASIVEVTDGEGRYGLTSYVTEEEELYIEAGEGNGDYSKVIANIDFSGVGDYVVWVENQYNSWEISGYYAHDGKVPGMSLGNMFGGDERGGWVFHTVSADDVNGITKIEDIQDMQNGLSVGDRIYVYGQDRMYRNYARRIMKNNEWFKLLIYLSTDDGTAALAAADYAAGMSGLDIVEKYKDKIAEFDKSYRVEIIQRTPTTVTVDEINNADLVYISEQEGIYGLKNKWAEVDNYLGGELPDVPSDTSQIKFFDTDDISGEVLLSIYENCLYHEEGKTPTTALIIDFSASNRGFSGDYATTNLAKLRYMMDIFYDPADFANFIGGYEENAEHQANNRGYSTILNDASITVYPNGRERNVYNQGIYYYDKYTDSKYGEQIEPVNRSDWDWHHFMVYNLIDHGTWIQVEQASNTGYTYRSMNGGFKDGALTVYTKDVQDGWTWFAPVVSGDNFVGFGKMNNIWKILHNRTSKKSSTPEVIVTNPDYIKEPEGSNAVTEYYIYVDEYMIGQSGAFNIDYKAIWTPEETTDPTPLTSLTVSRASGGVLKADSSPSYNVEYTYNTIGDFVSGGAWNGNRSMHYLIAATDAAGKTDTVSVYVIFRDSFMLN